jgi:hypothetical protein
VAWAQHRNTSRQEGLRATYACGEKPLGSFRQAEGVVAAGGSTARSFGRLAVCALALGLAGCANSNANGDPGPTTLSSGETCESIRANLTKMDRGGVPALVERQSAGKSMSAAQKGQADLYNKLLNEYLGARCHV